MVINKELSTETGVYIELECDEQSKEKLSEYVKKYIDPDSDYRDFHTTLIYSKRPFSGVIDYNFGNSVKKIYAKIDDFVRFDNPDQKIYAVAAKLTCKICEVAHSDLKFKYNFKYDYDQYIPHITLTYKGENIDVSKLPKPNFLIKFDKVNVEPLNEDWAKDVE